MLTSGPSHAQEKDSQIGNVTEWNTTEGFDLQHVDCKKIELAAANQTVGKLKAAGTKNRRSTNDSGAPAANSIATISFSSWLSSSGALSLWPASFFRWRLLRFPCRLLSSQPASVRRAWPSDAKAPAAPDGQRRNLFRLVFIDYRRFRRSLPRRSPRARPVRLPPPRSGAIPRLRRRASCVKHASSVGVTLAGRAPLPFALINGVSELCQDARIVDQKNSRENIETGDPCRILANIRYLS